MKNIVQIVLLPLLFIFPACFCYSQSLTVFNIDTSAYPVIKANFYAFDPGGIQGTNLSPDDFTVTENGKSRKVISVSCPKPKPAVALSSVLVIDTSSSMLSGPPLRIDAAKRAALVWIDCLPGGKSECAIVSFADSSRLLQGFTQDKTLLKSCINNIQPEGETNINQALYELPYGGLQIAKQGKYKRTVILITDDDKPVPDPLTDKMINFSLNNQIVIYAVVLGGNALDYIKQLTSGTGGKYFDNITTKEQAEKVYREILELSLDNPPCVIEWESGVDCPDIKNVDFTWNGMRYNINYEAPYNSIADLSISSRVMFCSNKQPGVAFDTNITVTASNAPYTVTDITSDNPAFDITPKSFSLEEGESIDLQLRFTPVDSSLATANFNFVNDLCLKTYYASADYKRKKKIISLRISDPNGAEVFAVGGDARISWEGVLPSDTFKLEYSTDNGISWIMISDKAAGLSYNWKNIPNTPSDKCLVRISRESDKNELIPHIEWQKCYGGAGVEDPCTILETNEGGYIIASTARSIDCDVDGNHGAEDFWITGLSYSGAIQWQKSLGGFFSDIPYSMTHSRDGGLIITGVSESNDGDLTDINNIESNPWIVKINQDGIVQWQKIVNELGKGNFNSVIETSDGCIVAAGFADHAGRNSSGNLPDPDYLIVKFDHFGNIIWTKTFGGTAWDNASSLCEAYDGGYLISGYSSSNNGDVTAQHGQLDYWLVKLDSHGEMKWNKCLGGSDFDMPTSIKSTRDGGFIIAGFSSSNDGNVSGMHVNPQKKPDFWIVRLNLYGNIVWQKCLGGYDYEAAYSVTETRDGGFLVTGNTKSDSNDGDITENHGDYDEWVVKLDGSGNIQWQKNLGGTNYDCGRSIQETMDGGCIIAGQSKSEDGDVKGNHGSGDVWVVKLSSVGFSQSDVSDSVFSIVLPIADAMNLIDFKTCLSGRSKDSLVAGFVVNNSSLDVRIDSIFIRGSDASAFALVSGNPPYVLRPDSSHYAEFMFSPRRLGVHNAEAVIITQADTMFCRLTGEGRIPDISFINDTIDIGDVFVGSYKDSLQALTIRNNETVDVKIISIAAIDDANNAFSVLAAELPVILEPMGILKLDLRYTAKQKGRESSILKFNVDSIEIPAGISLLGNGLEIEAGVVNNEIDFGSVEVGYKKDSSAIATISNTGNYPLNISGLSFTSPAFSETPGFETKLPYILQTGDTLKLSLRFNPSITGISAGRLIIRHNAPDSSSGINLTGNGLGTAVYLEDDSAYAGETKKLKLRLQKGFEPEMQALISSYKVKISYNRTVLTMIEPTATKSYDGNREIAGINSDWDGSSDILGRFEVIAGLGSSDTSILSVDDIRWYNADGEDLGLETDKINGRFRLLGVCHEGGKRLVNPDAVEILKEVYPNPGSDEIILQYEISGKGFTRIYISNILGERIKDILITDDPKIGPDTKRVDISGLSSGSYFVVLETPGGCKARKIEKR